MKREKLFLTVIFCICACNSVWADKPLTEEVQREVSSQSLETSTAESEYNAFNLGEKPVVKEKSRKHPTVIEGPSFFVRLIRIEGNSIFSQNILQAFCRHFEGHIVTFGELQNFADQMTSFYKMHGYTTAYVYIPPQNVIKGVVVIKVVEGRVGQVIVEGNRWFKSEIYEHDLSFKTGDYLKIASLESSLQRINEDVDRSAKLYLQEGNVLGTTDIDIKAQDYWPIHASYEYNLQGTYLTGYVRELVHLTDNNLSGRGDVLSSVLTFADAGALESGSLHYEFPDMVNDRIYHVDFGETDTHLLRSLVNSNVRGESVNFIPGITQTFLQTDTTRLSADFRLEIEDSKTTEEGQKYSYDRMRVIAGGPRLTMDDSNGRTLMGGDLHVGIPGFLGSSSDVDPEASRVESGGKFFYTSANVARVQRLFYGTSLVEKISGQYSASPLTSLEQYYLGGMYSVRGYPENDFSGDSGFSTSTEFRIPAYLIPESWMVSYQDRSWRDVIMLKGFIDAGRGFNRERQVASSEKDSTLLGAGFGFGVYITPDMNLDFDLGYPFGAKPSDGSHYHINLSIRIGF